MPFRRAINKKERGASLVEFSLVLPILFLVLVGIFEIGMAFKSYLTVAYLAREGARLAAFTGTDVDADCTTVTSLASQMGAQDLARLSRIEIFKADVAGNQSALTHQHVPFYRPRSHRLQRLDQDHQPGCPRTARPMSARPGPRLWMSSASGSSLSTAGSPSSHLSLET